MSDRFIIIIHPKEQLIDIACCEYYEDKDYTTLKDIDGSVIWFEYQQEAVEWILNNVKKDLINYESSYLTELKNSFINDANRHKFLINP